MSSTSTDNTPSSLRPAPLVYAGFCPITPKPKGRPRFNRSGVAYTDMETRKYETAVRKWFMRDYGTDRMPMDGALCAAYEFVIPAPKSSPRTPLVSSTRPDVDNYVKSFQDAMEFKINFADGQPLGVIENDSRISAVATIKRYAMPGETTGVWFRIIQELYTIIVDCRMNEGISSGWMRYINNSGTGNKLSEPAVDGVSVPMSALPYAGAADDGQVDYLPILDPRILRIPVWVLETMKRKHVNETRVVYLIGLDDNNNTCNRKEIVALLEKVFPNLERINVIAAQLLVHH